MTRVVVILVCSALIAACDRGEPVSDASLEKAVAQAPNSAPEVRKPGHTIKVYKSATCGCCSRWADHLEKNGFCVVLHDTEELGQIKNKFGVPADMQSCHTATIGEYVIEGHVPASDIEELVKTKPAQLILAVPGMPLGSPGMEHPSRSTPYESLLVGDSGRVTVFERH